MGRAQEEEEEEEEVMVAGEEGSRQRVECGLGDSVRPVRKGSMFRKTLTRSYWMSGRAQKSHP